MRLDTGNVLAGKMSAHRHQWNGSICAQPQGWNCGADATFRENYCAVGASRCFHIDVFKPVSPRFVLPDTTVIRAVREQPRLLDDQILVFYGGRFGAQQGIVQGDVEQALYGLYRVKDAVLDDSRTPHRLLVEPHRDGWAMLPRLKLGQATLRPVQGVAYLKQLRAKILADIIAQALEEVGAQKVDGWTAEHERNLKRASEQLPQWVRKAEEARAKLPAPQALQRVVVQAPAFPSAMAEKLSKLKIVTAPPATTEPAAHPVPELVPAPPPELESAPPVDVPTAEPSNSVEMPSVAPAESVPISTPAPAAQAEDGTVAEAPDESPQEFIAGIARHAEPEPEPERQPVWEPATGTAPIAIPEPDAGAVLAERLDATLITALSVAFLTKSLVILTGAPGAGKSWIAIRLLDDARRERTVIVPVASTWRGREDLLGYVNPITGSFEATEFTHFLCDTEEAWNRGDRRARLVVFEEFNLSQPEHWLSDLLVRLEYDTELTADRKVVLGGSAIAGRPSRPCDVVLVPSLRFVATLNNDHTVKPLSPRVLDRAALIEVSSSGRVALERAGLTIADDLADLVDDLNDLIGPRGAAFSVRSARSLQRALAANALKPSHALDLVLAQEVLSRVRLLAGDPRDEQLLSRLQTWSQKPECADLTVCAARIADWAESLAAGRDVFQA